jgi:acetylornithine deacetylase
MTDAEVLDAVAEQADWMEDLLARLVEAPTVLGAEEEGQRLMEEAFRDCDLEPRSVPLDADALRKAEGASPFSWDVDGKRNVVADCGEGNGRSLILNGHVDVVPPAAEQLWSSPPFSARRDGDWLYGRGACDMKAGLVAAIAAVSAVRRSGAPLRGDLLMACVAGEEDGGLGTFATLRRGWTADACVVPEPTGLDLVTANAGALTFRLRVPGLATHASRRTEGVSAVEKLVPLLAALQRLEADRNREVDPLMARWAMAYPLSIGRVRAGDWASSVPDLLVAEGRLGVALDEPVEDARAALELAVAEASAADPWLREHPVTVEWWGGQFASGRLAADSDLADRVAAAHHAVTGGGTPGRWGAPYGSDLRLLAGAGVPTLHYGPGDAVLAHAPDERVPLADVHTTTRTLALLALDICGVA